MEQYIDINITYFEVCKDEEGNTFYKISGNADFRGMSSIMFNGECKNAWLITLVENVYFDLTAGHEAKLVREIKNTIGILNLPTKRTVTISM